MVGARSSVPYCTVKGFRRCLDILRAETEASGIDRTFLVERGLPAHSVYPVLGALRYLGLIDGEGRPTPALASFLADDDVEGRRRVVERAYAGILASVTFPVDDREEVDAVLIEKHGCAAGVAAFCSTFFLWLSAEAGLPVAAVGRRRRGRPPAHLAQLSSTAKALLEARADALPGAARDLGDEFAAAEGGDAPTGQPGSPPTPPLDRPASSEA